jgi:competence protein ComEA
LLTAVAAVAALVAAVGVWRDRPQPVPVQAVSLAQVGDATGSAEGTVLPTRRATSPPRAASGGATTGSAPATTAATSSAEVLVVSVTGAVRHPGLIRLPAGSRVADAITRAGGVTRAADLTGVNLAARLTDGTSVVVSDSSTGGSSSVSGSRAGAAGLTSGTASRPPGKVDLNTADAATLDALPGVGPVTAAAIVAWREKNGRYTSVEQLQEIQGIGPAKYAALAGLVTV